VPDTAGWRVRVVPNKYPALEPQAPPPEHPGEQQLHRKSFETHLRQDFNQQHLHQHPHQYQSYRPAPTETLFRARPGYGVHEVLIETPEHNRHPGALSQEQMELVVRSYSLRCSALADDPNLRFIQLFRNHGREAGASIEHPHSQLIALPFVPAQVRLELERAHAYYLEHEDCPYCRLLAEERRGGARLIAENEFCSAYMPYASRYPFETLIVPRRHQSSFLEASEAELSGLAAIMGDVLGRLARALDDPSYNYYLHGAPLRLRELPHYHWHLELVPKLTTTAGFEMGSGVFINVTLPEEAARFLREKGGIENEAWRKDLLCPGPAQSPTRG
jgi:UDPglucose--hexose-1-phosphate uridylyltransferase